MRPRRYLTRMLTLGLLAAAAAPGVRADTSEADRGTLTATFHDFRNARGQALVALFHEAEGFPNEIEHAAYKKAFALKKPSLRLVLHRVPEGPLAVAVHHDENENFEMDTGLFGIPREGFGASRNAKARFGPPKYEDARVQLAAGQRLKLRIAVRYF